MAPDGSEVEIAAEGAEHDGEGEGEAAASGEIDCHFHAGVEHCVGPDGEDVASSCSRIERDYNVPLRVGLLFVILATSGIGELDIQRLGLAAADGFQLSSVRSCLSGSQS